MPHHPQTGRINWTNGPPSAEVGERDCPDCGPKPAPAFLLVRGSPSMRCMACMQKREKARKKYLLRPKKLKAALDEPAED